MNEEPAITAPGAVNDAAPAAEAPAALEASAVETVQGVPAQTPDAQSRPQQQSGFGMFIPMLLILAIFYFMMIKPQQRKEKERRQMISELRAGAKIVFAGGITGTIVEASEKTFKVETAPGVTMEILRECVQGAVK